MTDAAFDSAKSRQGNTAVYEAANQACNEGWSKTAGSRESNRDEQHREDG